MSEKVFSMDTRIHKIFYTTVSAVKLGPLIESVNAGVGAPCPLQLDFLLAEYGKYSFQFALYGAPAGLPLPSGKISTVVFNCQQNVFMGSIIPCSWQCYQSCYLVSDTKYSNLCFGAQGCAPATYKQVPTGQGRIKLDHKRGCGHFLGLVNNQQVQDSVCTP